MATIVRLSDTCNAAADITGFCDDDFAEVKVAFAKCFQDLGETGAALAVFHRGRLVCELFGGVAQAEHAWTERTLAMPYSVSKPVAALCCLWLVDEGRLCLEEPVRTYWPEFGAGKEECTVRQLLEHKAGIPLPPSGLTFEELCACAEPLAARLATLPVQVEGTAEHCLLYGHLCGELVRRVKGCSLGALLAARVAALGLDMHFGVPSERLRDCAELTAWPPATVSWLCSLTELSQAALRPDLLCQAPLVNSTAWRQAEVPAVNLHATARSLAELYSLLAGDGEGVLSKETLALLHRPGSPTTDAVLGFEARWALGFQHQSWSHAGADLGRFGLGGVGGSEAYGSARGELGYAYLTRQMGDWGRADCVSEAIHRCAVAIRERG